MSGENRTARPPEGGPEEGAEHQAGPSRRSLLRGAAGFAGAGLAASAVTGAIAGPAMAAGRPGKSADAEDPGPASGVVVHVRDTRTGEMDIFAGTSQVRLRDPQLAGQLARAVR